MTARDCTAAREGIAITRFGAAAIESGGRLQRRFSIDRIAAFIRPGVKYLVRIGAGQAMHSGTKSEIENDRDYEIFSLSSFGNAPTSQPDRQLTRMKLAARKQAARKQLGWRGVRLLARRKVARF